jgi:hypothetical protein
VPAGAARGHVLATDLIAGERVDFGRLPSGWCEPGFDDRAWASCVAAAHGYDTLVESPAPPVRRVEEIVPVPVARTAGGRQVVDLGRNINGLWRRADPRRNVVVDDRVGGTSPILARSTAALLTGTVQVEGDPRRAIDGRDTDGTDGVSVPRPPGGGGDQSREVSRVRIRRCR